MLAKDPADRPQTADSFGRRLNEVQQSLGLPPTEIRVPLTAANEATLAVTAPTHAGAATGPDSTVSEILWLVNG